MVASKSIRIRIVIVPECALGLEVETALTEGGHEVTHAASTAEAAQRLALNPRPEAILWIGDAAAEHDDPEQLGRARVPLVYVADEATAAAELPPRAADGVVWGWTPPALDRLVRELVTGGVYAAPLTEAVEDSILHALEDGFGIRGRIIQRLIKSDPRLPGEVNALVPFGGSGTRGRVMVSAARDVLIQLLSRVVGKESAEEQEQLEGFSSEIANLALGNLQRYFRDNGMTLSMSYPLRMRGREVRLHYLADAPTLTLVVGTPAGVLQVGFCLFHAHGRETWAAPSRDTTTGELTFL